MTFYRTIVEVLSRWIDLAAAAISAGRESLRTRRHVQLAEEEDGLFRLREGGERDFLPCDKIRIAGGHVDPGAAERLGPVLKGARVELILQPRHFLFRPLELPRRASEFLDGIIRAQIDRLTPWPAADAAFGWHSSFDAANDKIMVTIAATAQARITPFMNAIAAMGADMVSVSAAGQQAGEDFAPIRVCEQKAGQAASMRHIRSILIAVLAGASAIASMSVAANSIIGGMLEARTDDIDSRIAERRAAIQSGHGASEAARELEQRKHQVPASVIVMETLSRILPDDTYLTELRILGDKVQITGLTKDAPALIRLIEQTPHFTRATFFAPTTRSPSEQRDHFHIEAHIEPVYAPGL